MATTASVAIAPPAPLEKKGNLAENWRKWKQNFEIFLIASGIAQKDDKVACAHFLHTIGQYGRDIYNDLDCSEEEANTLEGLFSKFDNFCNPKSNLIFNRYQFFNTKQEKNQSFDMYLASLKQKSKNCEFGDLNNSLIMTQIISGISNTRLRERLLRASDLDLNQTIEECRTTEISEAQAKEITATTAAGKTKTKPSEKKQSKPAQPPPAKTKAVGAKPDDDKKQRKQQKHDKNSKSQQGQPKENLVAQKTSGEQPTTIVNMINCHFCGKSHIYGKCPAFGSTCNKCQKPNHFAKVCKNKTEDGSWTTITIQKNN